MNGNRLIAAVLGGALALGMPAPGFADDACAAGLAEIDGVLERTRLDALSAGVVERLRAKAAEAQEAGDSEACLELVMELRHELHLEH